MVWKIYAFIFAVVGFLSCSGTFLLLPSSSLPYAASAIFDNLLSLVAMIIVFRFAFGNAGGNSLWWKLFTFVYIVFDLAYNFYLCPAFFTHKSFTGMQATIFCVLSVPSYIAVLLYSSGNKS